MVKVHIQPGICGLETDVTVTSEDGQEVGIRIESSCPAVAAMQEDLGGEPLDGYAVFFTKFGDGPVCASANRHCLHPGCPVPAGIIKGVEVACGIALPGDVMIRLEKI